MRSSADTDRQQRVVHLVCNSHIDPVWLWERDEGIGVALSTFRAAADLCDQFTDFIFCHNEAILYQWVHEHEPELFQRIRDLVRRGQWNIMGGWYIQPDCNMPCGESFVRQILVGKRYFRENFGVDVRVGANLDPFGHCRGLVQILAKSGYDGYIFCRPQHADCPMPDDVFRWVGYDGSKVIATLARSHYNSPPGGARAKVEAWLETSRDRSCSLLLWGVGNHGGGASRRDLKELSGLIRRQSSEIAISHSTPQAYVDGLKSSEVELPRFARDLNPWAVGCYTSMRRIKHLHRQLEAALYMAEKMAVAAACQDLMAYPRDELVQAQRDLLESEFHDALPGSSIEPVQEATLRLLDHGLETVSRVKTRAFFALSSGQAKAKTGAFPILIYNPHPFAVDGIIECELQPNWPHCTDGFNQPRVYKGRKELPSQAEKEEANINEDHRKRVAFVARLAPGSMNRFDCTLQMQKRRPKRRLTERNGVIRFRTDQLDVMINARTGLIDRYRVQKQDYLRPGAGRAIVMADNADPWGMTVHSFRKRAGAFRLMSRREAATRSGIAGKPPPTVRVIEDGPVRSVVEAIFAYGHSFICQRYKLPKLGSEIEIELRVGWNEQDSMLKWSLPTALADAECRAQAAYGVKIIEHDGEEAVAQQWAAVVSGQDNCALTVINDGTYGLDFKANELRMSLLRSPAHAGHPVQGKTNIVHQDRFTPRIDQGEHVLRFWLNAGPSRLRMKAIDREAMSKAQQPMAVQVFPSGEGRKPQTASVLSDGAVLLAAMKLAEDGDDVIVRLFEPTGRARTTTLRLPMLDVETSVRLKAHEIRTLHVNRRTRAIREVDLMEQPLGERS